MAGPPAAPDPRSWCEGDFATSASGWPDSSGEGNGWRSSAVVATQPTILSGVLNGHNVASFDGVDDVYFGSTFQSGSGWRLDAVFNHDALTFFVVFKVNAISAPSGAGSPVASCDIYLTNGLGFGAEFGVVFYPPDELVWYITTVNANTFCIRGNEGIDWSCTSPPVYTLRNLVDVGEWDILACWFDGDKMHMRTARRPDIINSIPIGKIYNTGDIGCDGFLIGSNGLRSLTSLGFLDEGFNGEIAETVLYDRVLSCEEINGVLAYESEKYDIPCPLIPCGAGVRRMYTTAIGIH